MEQQTTGPFDMVLFVGLISRVKLRWLDLIIDGPGVGQIWTLSAAVLLSD